MTKVSSLYQVRVCLSSVSPPAAACHPSVESTAAN